MKESKHYAPASAGSLYAAIALDKRRRRIALAVGIAATVALVAGLGWYLFG